MNHELTGVTAHGATEVRVRASELSCFSRSCAQVRHRELSRKDRSESI